LITKIRSESTRDVSITNSVYNIDRSMLPKNFAVAARNWLACSDSDENARDSVLRNIYKDVTEQLSSLELWCLVGDSSWQTNTRVIRHRKLLRRLKDRGVEVTHAKGALEVEIENDGKVRYFCAIQFSEMSIRSVNHLMFEEPCSYIVAIRKSYDINLLISRGWQSPQPVDVDLMVEVVKNDGLLCKRIGEFDDVDVGFVVFAGQDVLSQIEQG